MHVPRNKGFLFTLVSALMILGGTYLAIQYANGAYRVTENGLVSESGLLSLTSAPTGAEVYINEKLVTATNDTLYLEPNSYQVKIKKDGYSEWNKEIQLQKGVVSQANALLFPSAPSLTPLTFTGVENISPSPDGQKILFYSASNSIEKNNGLYLLELSDNTLSFQRGSRQISQDSGSIDLATANFIWSPDSGQVLLLSENREILLDLSKLNDLDRLPDMSFRKKQLLTEWEDEMALREQQFLVKFPIQMIEIATSSATNVFFSPDKKKLLYTATASAQLADNLVPPLPGINSQTQERQLEPGGIYIYDREEDTNFRVGTQNNDSEYKSLFSIGIADPSATNALTATESGRRSFQSATSSAELAANYRRYHSPLFTESYQWFPDSKHIFFTEDDAIRIKEYDGANSITIYSGPFDGDFVFPWPDGSRLLIATQFSPNVPLNLYAIELR